MKKTTITLSLILALFAGSGFGAHAQDYDDDLYYSPSKEAKKQAERRKAQEEAARAVAASRASQYASADSYTGGAVKPLNIDVDTYNRRNESTRSVQGNTAAQPDFSYTRRIERYHNPDVVTATGDTALIDYYYATAAAPQQDINVYVINTADPATYAWNYNPWNNPAWGWPYTRWYYPYGNPYFSWSWGFDPWFNVSWGWGCGNPWHGPSWGWGWGWSLGSRPFCC